MAEADHALIKRCQHGDLEAFEKIVNRHKNRVFNLAFYLLRDENEAQDITQEVFLRVFQNIKKYEPRSSFHAWLYRITINQCNDFFRKLAKFRLKPINRNLSNENKKKGTSGNNVVDQSPIPEKLLENMEKNRLLVQSLNKLSKKHRAAIVLKEIEGLSYEEIALIVGCSLGTVKSQLFRAREKLKKILAPHY